MKKIWIVQEISLLAFICIICFNFRQIMLYTFDYETWIALGNHILKDISNIDKELLNWTYDAGLADLWVNHEWLSCVIMALTDRISKTAFGYITYAVFSIIVIVNYLISIKRGRCGNIIRYIPVTIALMLVNGTGFGRPAALSVIVTALYLMALTNWKCMNDKLRKGLLVSLLVLWGGIHGGSYPLSLVILICFILTYDCIKYAKEIIVSWLLATSSMLCVPIMRKSITYCLFYHGNTEYIQEWESAIDFHNIDIQFIVFTLITVIGILYQTKLHKSTKGKIIDNIGIYILLAGTLIMGIVSVRYSQYFGVISLICTPYLAEYDEIKGRENILVSVVTIAILVLCTQVPNKNIKDDDEFIKAAVGVELTQEDKEIILSNKDLRVFNSMIFDSFLVKNGVKTMIDGRIDNLHNDFWIETNNYIENLNIIRDNNIELLILLEDEDITDKLIEGLGDIEILSNHSSNDNWITIVKVNYQ